MAKKEKIQEIEEKIEVVAEHLIKSKGQRFADFMSKAVERIFKSFVDLLVKILRLKDMGKWTSVITVGVVLTILFNFVKYNNYSTEAMKIVIPALENIALTVFGIIGGFKGISGVVDQVQQLKNSVKGSSDEKK